MPDIISIAGLKRLSLYELRSLECELARRAGAHPEGSAQRRRVLADLALIRSEIIIRLSLEPRPGL